MAKREADGAEVVEEGLEDVEAEGEIDSLNGKPRPEPPNDSFCCKYFFINIDI